MQNVRVAQIGQTGQDAPFFEVVHAGKYYCFSTSVRGRLVMRTPEFLKALGVYSAVANRFESAPSDSLSSAIGLASDNTIERTATFAAIRLGSSLSFVSDWSNANGWRNIGPTFYRLINL